MRELPKGVGFVACLPVVGRRGGRETVLRRNDLSLLRSQEAWRACVIKFEQEERNQQGLRTSFDK